MFILTIGGDLRYGHLPFLARALRIECAAVGMENCPLHPPAAFLHDIPRADAIILPNPWRNGMQLPFAAIPFTLGDVLKRLRPDTPVLLSDSVGMPSSEAAFHRIDLSLDEAYISENALLTAEGALSRAMQTSQRALHGSSALVIGYGRIGRHLTKLLSALNVQVTAAARREESRRCAHAQGAAALDIESMRTRLSEFDFIFSTVPACLLDHTALSRIRSDALLMDLASPPFGFDLALAQSLGVNASRENNLPGRYCPLSAAQALLNASVRALSISPKGGIS